LHFPLLNARLPVIRRRKRATEHHFHRRFLPYTQNKSDNSMRAVRFFVLFLFISWQAHSQIAISKIVGKDSKDFGFGYGAFLKFPYRVSEAADVTLEIGLNIFPEKDDPSSGWANVPIKAGYRYTLNGSGSGFYIEPQAGYNIYGAAPDDNQYKGFVFAGTAGYLFQPIGRAKFDLGLLYETSIHKGGNANYVSLRLAYNFALGRRDSDD
jgi:hypothetical protein